MTFTKILDTKVVDDEAEEDRATFVVPKTCSGGSLVVDMLV